MILNLINPTDGTINFNSNIIKTKNKTTINIAFSFICYGLGHCSIALRNRPKMGINASLHITCSRFNHLCQVVTTNGKRSYCSHTTCSCCLRGCRNCVVWRELFSSRGWANIGLLTGRLYLVELACV